MEKGSSPELACIQDQLQTQGTSTAALAQQGIFPTDGRVAGIRTGCARAPGVPPAVATLAQPIVPTSPQPLSATQTFDCTRARSATGLILCGDRAGADADWGMSAVYWANLSSLAEADRDAFKKAHDDRLQSLNQTCRLSPEQFPYSAQQRDCVLRAFRTKALDYRSRLRGDALVESTMSPEDHARIQNRLIEFGLLDGRADGEYGPRTRGAIRLFQQQFGLPWTGFLTAQQKRQLLLEPPAVENNTRNGTPPSPSNELCWQPGLARNIGIGEQPCPFLYGNVEDVALKASKLTVVEAENQCQSNDTNKRLVGCTAIINSKGEGYSVALADAFDGRCWVTTHPPAAV
jgi:hypothetical protein